MRKEELPSGRKRDYERPALIRHGTFVRSTTGRTGKWSERMGYFGF